LPPLSTFAIVAIFSLILLDYNEPSNYIQILNPKPYLVRFFLGAKEDVDFNNNNSTSEEKNWVPRKEMPKRTY
jgi:hypothetical protein